MSESTTPIINPPFPVRKKKKKSRKKMFWIISILLIVLIVVAVIMSGKKEELITVQTEKISKRNITQLVTATGKIQSETEVDISAEVSGEIVSLPFKEGEQVKKGALLVKIKQEAFAPQLQQQNAAINVAESNLKIQEVSLRKFELELDRIKQLYDKGLATSSDMDNAQINVDQIIAQINSNISVINQQRTGLSSIKYDISKTTIYAPIDGTVTQLNNESGEKVLGTISNQGSNIMTISDLSKMECQVDVGETDVSLINIGDTALIEIDAFPDRIFKGYVYEIANSAQASQLGTQDEVVNFIVKVRIIDNDVELRPGMSCTVDIEVEKKTDVLAVPIQSVTVREEKDFGMGEDNENENLTRESENRQLKKERPDEIIFFVDNSIAKTEKVKTGISDDSYIEILEGVTDGQEVIKGSFKAISKELEDGKKVKVDNEMKKNNFGSSEEE
ncbi:MAG TPA: efflux RND transporter periplasmic adaptor subunit [Ignavibacteria bacterium]|nr:efflux RND transporter periplasmic adaptor subunit [Ignavibacteria bacterium]